MKISRLFQFNKRDYIGLACWLVVGFVFGIGSIVVVIAREVYQWKRYKLAYFEWEDVVRYGIVILLSVAIRYSILGISAYRLLFL